MAIRDRYLSAEVMGVNLFTYKLLAFGVSSFLVGIAGSLYGHYYHGTISPMSTSTSGLSVQYLAMIIIGGMGSRAGGRSTGPIFMTLLPEY